MDTNVGSGAHGYVVSARWNKFVIKVASGPVIATEASFYGLSQDVGVTPACYGAFLFSNPSMLAMKDAAVLILDAGSPVTLV